MPFPNANIVRQTFTFRDAKGQQATVRFFANGAAGTVVQTQTQLIAVRAAIVAMSNAALQSASGLISEVGIKQYGAAGDYQDVQMKALMVFQDSAGILHKYQIPSPKTTIFRADLQTVDPAQVAAFIAAMTGNTGGNFVSSQSGLAMANFFGGVFLGKRIPKQRSIFILDSSLTPAEPAE